MLPWKGDFSKIVLSLQRGLDVSDSEGSWEDKSTKHRSKNEVQDGVHLGIDFWAILVDFWIQVGMENRSNIDPKRHRKNDAKLRGTRKANNGVLEASWRRLRVAAAL